MLCARLLPAEIPHHTISTCVHMALLPSLFIILPICVPTSPRLEQGDGVVDWDEEEKGATMVLKLHL